MALLWAQFAAAAARSSALYRLSTSTLAPCEPRWRVPVGYRSCLPTLGIGPLADDNLRLWPFVLIPVHRVSKRNAGTTVLRLAVTNYLCGLISTTPWRNRNTKRSAPVRAERAGAVVLSYRKITQRSGGRTIRLVVNQLRSLLNYANTNTTQLTTRHLAIRLTVNQK